jgi:penicillin-insensitive murein endopeptidase
MGTDMSDSMPPKDCRGYFMLPQHTEHGENGYYTYGTPLHGARQYAHPRLLSLICMIEHIWQGIDNRKIGIGNISLFDGPAYKDHEGHKSGLEVDIRLFRKDGKAEAVERFDKQYDRDATARLIETFFHSGMVQVIYFNDDIPGVKPRIYHDNHFHVTVKP